MSATDHERYAEWDAAYVLGSLSPADRREFETHLDSCKRCRAEVAELGALPGLLGRLDAARAVALLADGPVDPAIGPPSNLVERIEHADRRRRLRRRLGSGIALAAAAAIAAVLALVLPPILTPGPAAPAAVAAELRPVAADVPVEGDVALTPVTWGTQIDMHCGYHPAAGGADGPYGPVAYAMWIVDRAGDETALSSWKSSAGSDVTVTAGTSLELAEIARIEIRAVAGGQLLLEAAFPGDAAATSGA